MTTHLIIDTDAGIDDAIAILLALASPSHNVAAITCVDGNVAVDRVTRNVPIVLDAARADAIPVYRGADQPLHVERHHASDIHGEDGLGDAGFLPSRRTIEKEHAVATLVRMARQNPGAYELVTLGPLTNIALAIAIEPEFPKLFKRITTMGGAVRGMGNVTAAAEFNIYADPEAAAIVFDRVPELTLLPWETCLDNLVPFAQWQQLTDAGPLGREFVRPMTARLGDRLRRGGVQGIPLPDPLAMAVVLDDTIGVRRPARVDVETGGRLARGLTAVTEPRRGGRPANTQIVTTIDMPKFVSSLEDCFRQVQGQVQGPGQ